MEPVYQKTEEFSIHAWQIGEFKNKKSKLQLDQGGLKSRCYTCSFIGGSKVLSENAFPNKIGTIMEETIISKMTGAKYSALTIPTASPF